MITPSFGFTATERVLPRLALDWTTGVPQAGVDVARLGTATFIGSNGLVQSAAANTQRIDYGTGIAGLLVEESRQNVFVWSSDLSQAPWTASGASPSIFAETAPDGAASVYGLIEDSANTAHSISRNQTLVSGATYTYSQFVKPKGRNIYLRLDRTGASGTNIIVNFDLVNGTVGTAAAAGTATYVNSGIDALANGWYRCWISGSLGAFTDGRARMFLLNGTTVTYQGDGVSGVYSWLAQLELGAFPTSAIPTEATAVTRNADVATMTGTNFSDWYSAGAGGVVARVLPSTVSGTRPALQFDDATANEVITLRGNTTNPELVIVDGGSPQAQIDAGTIAANTAYNLGAAWNTDNCAAAVNGGAAVTDTTATIPTVTQARLGSDGTNYLNGNIQTLRYWPQRIIDAEVQAFSK